MKMSSWLERVQLFILAHVNSHRRRLCLCLLTELYFALFCYILQCVHVFQKSTIKGLPKE